MNKEERVKIIRRQGTPSRTPWLFGGHPCNRVIEPRKTVCNKNKNQENMSLDVFIVFPEKRQENYFLSHPYSYDYLSDADKNRFSQERWWKANVTHNLGAMAGQVPVMLKDGAFTTLYSVVWRPEEVWEKPTTTLLLPCLIDGINFMLRNRGKLLKFEPDNGWGTYNGFMKFLLNYKQACEDNPECLIETDR